MTLFRRFLVATTITYVLSVNGTSNYCPDGEENAGDGISCKKCEEGSFRNGDMNACQAFKTCDSKHQAKLFDGNKTHDVVCHCPTKPFTVIDGKLCLASCPEGEYFIDSTCQPCPPGKWKNFTGKDTCLSCTQCSKSLYECNSTHDAICELAIGELTTEAYKNSSTYGDPSTGASSLNTGTIIAVVLVLAAVVTAFVVAGVCWCRKHRRFKFSSGSSEDSPSSPAAKPLMSPQNGDQNKSNAFANSLDTSTNHQSHLFSICCLPHHNADAGSSQRPNKSQQHKNSNLEDDSKPNETPGQPMVGLNSEVDPQVVANPAMASASLQHTDNREPQQNGNPNDNLPASGIRDREDPVNQNENTSLRPNDSQQNKNNSPTDDSKPQISGQIVPPPEFLSRYGSFEFLANAD